MLFLLLEVKKMTSVDGGGGVDFLDLIHRGSSFAINKSVSRVNTSAEQQMSRIQFVSDISIYESLSFEPLI